MALTYDFRKLSNEEGDKRYAGFDDKMKTFHHQWLPFMLMRVDIGHVCEESIPHIVARLNLVQPGWLTDARKELGVEDMEAYLKNWIGFCANVCTEPNSKFLKRVGRSLPPMTSKQAEKIGW